ncbi:MAG: peptidylprolyl isomerase [Planctomycetes bacterium]|nr:peptidylprolyl isomerase [Planctomycetota bacterium]
MSSIRTAAVAAFLVLCCGVAGAAEPNPNRPHALITTSLGDIIVELYADEAPRTVENFLALAAGTKPFTDPATGQRATRPFYDGLVFHRVIKGFMIQGGDPLGTGSGGPGFTFADEISAKALGLDAEKALIGPQALNQKCAYQGQDFMRVMVQPLLTAKGVTEATPQAEQEAAFTAALAGLKDVTLKDFYTALGYHYDDALPGSHVPMKGSLAMANSGPDTNGSQFFINLGDTPHLAGKHTVFGQVIAGLDVVEAIGTTPVDQNDRPSTPVVIKLIRVIPGL